MSEDNYVFQHMFKLQKTWVIDYRKFEELVNHMYYPRKLRYDFVAAEEARNDTEHLFEVSTQYDEIDWSDPWTSDLFGKLCADGIICPGKYLVKVSW